MPHFLSRWRANERKDNMITKYTKKDGTKRYVLQVYLGIDPTTGRPVKTTRRGIRTEREAKILEAQLKAEFMKNGELQRVNRVTFKEICDLWLIQYETTVKENTFVIQKQVINKHIIPKLGNKFIDKIKLQDCQSIANEWYSSYSKANSLVSVVARIFDFAMSYGYVTSNPMKSVIRPKNTHKKKYDAPFYNKAELTQFMTAIANEPLQVRLMFRLLAFTGLRKAELLALRWSDLTPNTLTVNRVLVKGKKNLYKYQSPKTKTSERTISLDIQTAKLLNEWRIEQREYLFKFGRYTKKDAQLIFVTDKNTHLAVEQPNRLLNKIITENDLPFMTIHGFRHTHCSLLFEAGVQLKEVQERLGHANIQTTLDIYTHVTARQKEKTAHKFAEFMAI